MQTTTRTSTPQEMPLRHSILRPSASKIPRPDCNLSLFSTRRRPRRLTSIAISANSAAASATITYNFDSSNNNSNGSTTTSLSKYQEQLTELLQRPSTQYTPPTALPSTPTAASMAALMPYLARLALGESQLYWRVAGALVALLVSKAAGLFAPLYFKHAVDALSSKTAASTTAMHAALTALVISGVCRAASALAKELQHPLFTPVSQAAGRRASFYALAHVLNLDLYFHLNRNTGALSRMLERGARSIAMIFRAVVFTLAPTALELTAVCILLAQAFRPQVFLLVLATFVAYTAWTVGQTSAATKIRREVKDLDNVISGRAVDALLNVEAVKLSGAEPYEVETYDENLTAYQTASVKLEKASATLNAGQAAILSAGMTAALVAAVKTPGITAGDLVMVQGFLLQLWAPLQFLGWFYRELRQSLVDMEDLFALLRTKTKVPEGEGSLPLNGTGLKVELKDVRFRYPESPDREILKGVNITAEPGQSIAVVGPSGSGKSTLLRLLVRLFDVESGSVVLNGKDVRQVRSSELRSTIAVVPQETVLFNDTILHNIIYGREEHGVTPEEVQAAVKAAKLESAINIMAQGLATRVGERGLKLSGGEKQRVAIARAFLRQPRLIVCDEATSALDSETERGIMASLQELASGRTSIFVAHRLSTVQSCDKIYVLKDGEVAEEGSHAELMAKRGGVYREMWKMQAAQQALEKKAEKTGVAVVVGSTGNEEHHQSQHNNNNEGESSDSITIENENDDNSNEAAEELNTEAAAVERSL